MSRIGLKNIEVKDVEVKFNEGILSFSKNQNSLNVKIHDGFTVEINESKVLSITPTKENLSKFERSIWGTMVSLCKNAVEGLTKGFQKEIQLVGVGFKASLDGSKLKLQLGLSHDVFLSIPQDVSISIVNPAKFVLSSFDKQKVGDFAVFLSKYKRKYNPYTGCGIIINDGRFYRRKEAKKK
jgi:large subunit ribosomal protein L6